MDERRVLRMNITRGKQQRPQKVVIYGAEGIGKSTFASRFPEPVFIDTEDGTSQLDIARMDKPTSYEMLKAQINYVIENKPCKTLVIDTIDWAEQIIVESVCSSHNKKGVEDFGYGAGYVYVREEVGRFLNLLQDVIEAGIHVVLTAHAKLRKFEQPDEMGAYDRWELKLGRKTSGETSSLVKEWADMVLFCNYKTMAIQVDDKGKKHKAQGGRRVMYTSHHPCWDAKNRHGLPEEMDMGYEGIAHIFGSMPQVSKPVAEKPKAEPKTEKTKESPKQEKDELDGVPKALADLMRLNNVTIEEIQSVVAGKGHFPKDTPITNYPKDYIEGVLIGAWEKVFGAIKETRQNNNDLPF